MQRAHQVVASCLVALMLVVLHVGLWLQQHSVEGSSPEALYLCVPSAPLSPPCLWVLSLLDRAADVLAGEEN